MSTEIKEADGRLFTRWVRATAVGWLLGFGLVIVLALAWDMVGGGAQFMVGVGMGAGVGYMQSRVVRLWVGSARGWSLASIIGMGAPFVLWDISAAVGIEFPMGLPLSVLVGGLFVGILQRRLLRPHSDRATWWVPACIVGWGLPAGAIALGDHLPGPGNLFSVGAMFFGGVILGAVTGKTLLWMLHRSEL